MKRFHQYIMYSKLLLAAAAILVACEDDYESNADAPAILLTSPGQEIKAPGHGQYRVRVLSGEEISIETHLGALKSARSFTITKTINLAVDTEFGDQGVLTVDPASVVDKYLFVYKTDSTEIDQLIGFNFRVEEADGSVNQSDLTVAVTLSPRDNLPRKKWLLTAKIWVDGNNEPDFKECEKDNVYFFNKDNSMVLNYGEDTGSPGCDYDAFIDYYEWSLTEDEKTFIMKRYNGSPNNSETETYRVQMLTTEKLALEIDYDLSVFGLGTEETYRFEFTALPK